MAVFRLIRDFYNISILFVYLLLIVEIQSEEAVSKKNVALSGKTKQSSVLDENSKSDYAVDGDSGTCSQTNTDANGNWTVDLGSVHTVAHMLLDTGNTFFGTTFEVYTAQSPNGAPTLCNYGETADILPEYTLDCFDGPRIARFVTVTNLRSGGVKLCEIRVMECKDGYFDKNCSKQCHCDKDAVCDKLSGSCPDLCAPGYNGTDCQNECTQGTFGASCLKTCHCLTGVSCDKVTGQCPTNECADSWLGPSCQTGLPRIISAPNLFSSRATEITLTWQSWNGFVHPSIDLFYQIEYRLNRFHKHDDEWKKGPLVGDTVDFNERALVAGLVPNSFYDFRVIPTLHLNDNNQVPGMESPVGLSFRTRCTLPEATNITKIYSWVDTSRQNPTPVISVEWELLTREQSNCENMKYYEIIYQKPSSTSPWQTAGARHTESSKNITSNVEFNIEYWVFVVAHNNEDLDSSSIRKKVLTPPAPEVLVEANQGRIDIAIIAGVIVFIGLLVAVAVALVLYRNKMKSYSSVPTKDLTLNGVMKTELSVVSRSPMDGSGLMESSLGMLPDVTVVPMYPENGRINRDRRKPPPPKRYPIKVEGLEEYIGSRQSNEYEELRKEYREIPEGNAEATMEHGKKGPNQLKNRFINILPYDHSRVILDVVDGDEDSSYINANYLDGYKKPRAYIASQGCNKWTIQDLWRMLWQVNCHRIIMVTNLVEKGRTKCELYWPEKENEEKNYHDLYITLTDTEKTADFVIRTFEVRRRKDGGAGGGDAVLLKEGEEWEIRNVKQFHYTTWPDHGVPTRASPIIAFRRKLRSFDETHPGPVITHCSAGVGRTGAFIAIDYLLEQAVAEGVVDVYNLTCNMRKDRVNMIQTVEQYIFVYDALLEALRAGNTVIACAGFKAAYEELRGVDPEKNKSRLDEQFELLQKILAKNKREICSLGDQEENKEKNRFPNLLPADKHRPYLMTRVQGTNDYINAVFIDGYRSKNAYIITQMPLPHTVIDLWRLVYEHECGTVVMLNPWNANDQSYGQYWPEENEECECGPFFIEPVSASKQHEHLVARELKLTYNPDTSSSGTRREVPPRVVNHFQLTCWDKDASIPQSSLALLSLIEMVERSQKTSGNSTIVIHCHDGVRQSGLYAAVTSIWERVKDDQEVDIFQTVKHLQYHRPDAMQDIEQYRFCHEMVLTYLAEFETYSNYR